MSSPGESTTTAAPATPPADPGRSAAANGRPSPPPDAAPQQPGPAAVARPDVTPDSRVFNRDLAWLEFNRRVLSLAEDERRPLLERVKFLSIFSNNLDEFVMKRIGWLRARTEFPPSDYEPWPTAPLLECVRRLTSELQQWQSRIYRDSIRPALAHEGIHLLEYSQLTPDERRRIDAWFAREVFPVLTPLAVDPGHRFPFISNQSENLAVLVTESEHAEPLFARVKVPGMFSQWVRVPEGEAEAGAAPGAASWRFVHLHDIIRNNLDDLFPGMKIVEVAHFRVVRNAEVEAEDDDSDNLLELVEAQLRQRRFARAVRLEISSSPSRRILTPLLEELKIGPEDVEERTGPLDYHDLNDISDLDRPDLKNKPWRPVVPVRLADKDRDIFSVIRDGDVLVHHPYESFEASAQRFVTEAARDPNVLAIKQTIYRTSRDSPFVQSLIRAAEAGKQVACLVELRARFDEQSNVRFARMLEKAGAHVAYGVVGLKTHCKASLVIRRETDEAGANVLRAYAHLGTGNYHPKTAQLYTDLSVFTANPAITEDVVDLFNFLTGRSLKSRYRSLLVAPVTMKSTFLELIDREIAIARDHARGASPVGGRIIAKMNAMEDRTVMAKLYEASKAGVEITLYVRGFCCLRPGVPGLSETIKVVSVVGRFLEHSRIFHFGAGKTDPVDGEWFISSADWMYRNLNNRVESACPVLGREPRARLVEIFDVMAHDRRTAWELRPDGSYAKRPPDPDAAPDSPELIGTFETLMLRARQSVGV
ncbi:MAG: polyphosphate kinase 1 [Phycisphaeraceae bacterium]|nr:polyphosphate kinase 1 [Phycisphaeraceae bacterium]